MKTTIVQTDIIWGKPKENVLRLAKVIDGLTEVDLIVLPEMFTTGFVTSPKGFAESPDCDSLQWMKRIAAQKDCAVAGSIAIQEGCDKFFNRFYFVKPDGDVVIYDKKHLFTFGGEDKTFTAGSERVTVEWRGVRILLQICYDLRFPCFSRNRLRTETGKPDYDMILYVASWPTVRIGVWKTLLRARAIENQCYVAGVNRVGTDPYCEYSGGSALIDPYGVTLASCSDSVEGTAVADIDIDSLNRFRAKFPVLNDADILCTDPK
ncbi:MAG: nitrilase family protein [Bacteroidales bacterium]